MSENTKTITIRGDTLKYDGSVEENAEQIKEDLIAVFTTFLQTVETEAEKAFADSDNDDFDDIAFDDLPTLRDSFAFEEIIPPLGNTDFADYDDFFNSEGRFLYSKKGGSNSVQIVMDTDTKLITDFDYSPNNSANIAMLCNIQSYYAAQIGINQEVTGTKYVENDGAVYYNPRIDIFGVGIDKNTNKINYSLSDINNIKNSWYHEKRHQDDPTTEEPLKHVQVVLDQVAHHTFEKTTSAHKQSRVTNVALLLNEAIEKGASTDEIISKIGDIHKSRLGDIGILTYNQKSNRVSVFSFLLPEAEIEAENLSK